MKAKALTLTVVALVTTGSSAEGRPTTRAPKPTLSMAQARTIALQRAPGRVQKAEYEREGGGWRYSFDVVQGHRIHEIGVDARTGRIVEDAFEAIGGKD